MPSFLLAFLSNLTSRSPVSYTHPTPLLLCCCCCLFGGHCCCAVCQTWAHCGLSRGHLHSGLPFQKKTLVSCCEAVKSPSAKGTHQNHARQKEEASEVCFSLRLLCSLFIVHLREAYLVGQWFNSWGSTAIPGLVFLCFPAGYWDPAPKLPVLMTQCLILVR